MDKNPTTRKWIDIRGLAVVVLDTGIKVGTVDDFYFESESNAVRGLRVNTGLSGYKELPSNGISAIGRDAITTANQEMVIDERHDGRLPALPLGHSLLSYKIMSESGDLVGTVGSISYCRRCDKITSSCFLTSVTAIVGRFVYPLMGS